MNGGLRYRTSTSCVLWSKRVRFLGVVWSTYSVLYLGSYGQCYYCTYEPDDCSGDIARLFCCHLSPSHIRLSCLTTKVKMLAIEFGLWLRTNECVLRIKLYWTYCIDIACADVDVWIYQDGSGRYLAMMPSSNNGQIEKNWMAASRTRYILLKSFFYSSTMTVKIITNENEPKRFMLIGVGPHAKRIYIPHLNELERYWIPSCTI